MVQEKGKAPVKVTELAAGPHEVKVLREGYKAYEEKVMITAGRELEVKAILEKEIKRGSIKVRRSAQEERKYI